MRAHIEHPKLATLEDFWSTKCAGREMPARDDIDVLELAPWMGHLSIMDVIDGGADFYVRLHGTRTATLYGLDLTGKLVSDLPSEVGSTLSKEYRELVKRAEPIIITRVHVLPKKDYTNIIKLLLPLSSDGESEDQIISASYPVNLKL